MPRAPRTAQDANHIVLVSDSYQPLTGGATRAIRQLGKDLLSAGKRVTVVTAWQYGAPAHEDDEGIDVYRIRDVTSRLPFLSSDSTRHTPPPFPDPEATLRLNLLIRRLKPDVVYAYGWLAHSCALALVGSRIPFILSARDHGNVCALRTFLRGEGHCEGPAPVKCLRCSMSEYGPVKGAVAAVSVRIAVSLLRRRADALQSCSRYLQDVMRRFLFPGKWSLTAAGKPDVVITDYRTTPAHRPEGPEPDAGALALLPDDAYILFVGALRRVKGLGPLLTAYSQLAEAPPLVLMGPRAPDTPSSFPRGVTVVPPASNATVMAAWSRALFGVAPSILPEPFGNVVHEAMACGKTVIGTRPGGHAEMIEHGVSGLLVPCNDVGALRDAMEHMIRDGDTRERMGRAALDGSRRFTKAMVFPGYMDLFRRTSTGPESVGRDLPAQNEGSDT